MRRLSLFAVLAGCTSSQSAPLVEPAVVMTVMTVEPAAPVITPPSPAIAKPAIVVELTKSTTVLLAPSADAAKVGVIKKSTRVAVTNTADGDASCARWLEIAPKGWLCEAATTPTLGAPTSTTNATIATLQDDGELAPIRATYGIVRRGTIAFSSRDAAVSGEGRALEGSNTVRARGSTTIDGTRYWITTKGDLIDAARIYHISPSRFKGSAIEDGVMPAWIRGRRDPYKPVAFSTTPGGRKHGELPARMAVTILEEAGAHVRVDTDTWIARTDVRIARATAAPEGTGPDEKWFDIDLDTQILVAYEGERPVYATLVSTGKFGHYTPTLIARINSKHEATPMTSDKGDIYSVADVPWTMFYDGNYALHTSYWHDGFGGPRSHGCINLAPRDARLLFAWSSPDVPAGWSSVYGSEAHPGSMVRVHADRMPAPKLRGYARAMRMRDAAPPVVAAN